MHAIKIRTDTFTELGILPAGMTVQAEPSEDYSAWVVEMSLPRAAGIPHPLTLPRSAVWPGVLRKLDTLDQIRCAHHDYAFARELLGLGHLAALRWIMRGYQSGYRTLQRWGFAVPDDLEAIA
ncbi:hypothetical protein [Nocardia sp. NPDC058480]|uniref:hypothetical protein n=1 Tax=Nocardia sp. NPDC058480 TaxID=3346522 RepID=UPI00365087DC